MNTKISLLCLMSTILSTASLPEAQAKGEARLNKRPKQSKQATQLVPPPPATPVNLHVEPAFMISPGTSLPLEYLSKEELQLRRKDLLLRLSSARVGLDSSTQSLAEKQARTESFEGLYKEGVVSRRELETARREAFQAGEEHKDCRQRVKDLERELAEVETHLQKKGKKPWSASLIGQRSKSFC